MKLENTMEVILKKIENLDGFTEISILDNTIIDKLESIKELINDNHVPVTLFISVITRDSDLTNNDIEFIVRGNKVYLTNKVDIGVADFLLDDVMSEIIFCFKHVTI